MYLPADGEDLEFMPTVFSQIRRNIIEMTSFTSQQLQTPRTGSTFVKPLCIYITNVSLCIRNEGETPVGGIMKTKCFFKEGGG